MGRTVAPYSVKMELVAARFDNFRKALRRQDRERFDELMRSAKNQVQAGVMAQHPNAFDSISMAIHLDLKRQIDELNQRFDQILNQRLKQTENRPPDNSPNADNQDYDQSAD